MIVFEVAIIPTKHAIITRCRPLKNEIFRGHLYLFIVAIHLEILKYT